MNRQFGQAQERNAMFVNIALKVLAAMFLVVTAPAFAGKDDLYVSNVGTVTVGGDGVDYTSSLAGNNRQLTISDPIVGAQAVSVEVTWAIAAGSAPRTTNFPKDDVGFTASTASGTDVGAIGVTPTTCDFTTSATTCLSTVTFVAPNVTDTVQLKIDPTNTGSGNTALTGKNLFINFSVIEQVAKTDTALTVPDPQCFPYMAGDVNLKATLTELVGGDPIEGRQVDFTVNSDPVGSGVTDDDGEALLSYDVNGLPAGDHNLYAEFLGDDSYNGSNGSATLGIYYNFVGFQPPINPQGNSVFGNGRVIPIKIKAVDANLNPVTDAKPEVWVYQWSPSTGLGEVLEAATSVSSADTDNVMRYVPEDQQYVYNWDLSGLANGTYAVVVDLGDSDACGSGPYFATITVDKKGGKK